MRRMGLVLLAFGFGSFTLMASMTSHDLTIAEARAEEQSAADCVGFSKTDVDKGFEYAVNNSCSKKLTCTLSWTVTCEDSDGRVTSKKHETKHLALDADGSASTTASAAACKQGWSIDDVAWSCREAK